MGLTLRRRARRHRAQRRKRKMWVHPMLQMRRRQGAFHQLIQELRLSDHERHFGYLRMTKETFDLLLQKVRLQTWARIWNYCYSKLIIFNVEFTDSACINVGISKFSSMSVLEQAQGRSLSRRTAYTNIAISSLWWFTGNWIIIILPLIISFSFIRSLFHMPCASEGLLFVQY